jgi:leucyl-tRNA synthetase
MDEESPMDEGTPRFGYDARLANEIELRWQDRWEREGTFRSPNPPGAEGPDPLSDGFANVAGRPKFYLIDFFPYPSGIGLHVGHPLGYIGTDVFGRYLGMTGHHVLHPFGFDTFGRGAAAWRGTPPPGGGWIRRGASGAFPGTARTA